MTSGSFSSLPGSAALRAGQPRAAQIKARTKGRTTVIGESLLLRDKTASRAFSPLRVTLTVASKDSKRFWRGREGQAERGAVTLDKQRRGQGGRVLLIV